MCIQYTTVYVSVCVLNFFSSSSSCSSKSLTLYESSCTCVNNQFICFSVHSLTCVCLFINTHTHTHTKPYTTDTQDSYNGVHLITHIQ